MTGVQTCALPIYAIGYISDPVWECDWAPANNKLNVGVKLIEGNEYDMFGNLRPEENITLGAIEFGAGTGIEGIVTSKDKLDPFVYFSEGKVRVNNMTAVSVEIYTVDGMKVATAAAASNHAFEVAEGMYVVVVKDAASQVSVKVMAR